MVNDALGEAGLISLDDLVEWLRNEHNLDQLAITPAMAARLEQFHEHHSILHEGDGTMRVVITEDTLLIDPDFRVTYFAALREHDPALADEIGAMIYHG